MSATSLLLAYVVAAWVLTITPGPDSTMVLRTATVEGPWRATLAGIGIGLGCLVWGAAVSLGLGALIAASPLGFAVLTWVGAAYLVWIGVWLLLRPRSTLDEPDRTAAAGWFTRGLVTNLLNPKIGIFYVTFLPQFVPAGVNVAGWTFLLVGIHLALTAVWFALLIGASLPLNRVLHRPGVIRALDRLTGGLFIAFGARLALVR